MDQELLNTNTNPIAISASDLHLSYRSIAPVSSRSKTKDSVPNRSVTRKGRVEHFEALHGVTFDIAQGEIVGLVGRNGSGKSTLLRVLAGIFEPDSGTVDLHEKTVSLLALGVGFIKELSGRENIYLSGLLMGFTRKQIDEQIEEIIAFSELGSFIEKPVRTYSSGMNSKLGFAITAVLKTDIILVDEVLSVGDAHFKKKSFAKMMELISDKSRTVVIVSHNADTIRRLCTTVIWLHDGDIRMVGPTKEVMDVYDVFMNEVVDANIANGTCETGLTWILDASGKLTIVGNGTMPDYTADSDTSCAPWAEYADQIQTLFVGSSVENLGANAFCSCKNLSSVKLNSGLKRIDWGAFAGCSALTELSIPGTVTDVGDGAFAGSGLTAVTMLSTITDAGSDLFRDCTALERATINSALHEGSGTGIFAGCTALTCVSFGGKCTHIPASMFENCSALAELRLPGTLQSIGDDAFAHTALPQLRLPEGVLSIGRCAFAHCPDLAEVSLRAGLESVQEQAFFDCPSLHKIALPQTIGYNREFNCWETDAIGPQAFGYGPEGKCSDFAISCCSGSAAEQYAERNGFPFSGIAAEAPILNALENTTEGVRFCWSASGGKDAVYHVLRKSGDAAFAEIGTALSTEYLDTTAQPGVSYCYSVCVEDRSGRSEHQSGLYVTRVGSMGEVRIETMTTNIRIFWSEAEGAAGYQIYRRVGTSGSFVKVAAAPVGKGHYSDSTPKEENGTVYTYQVVPYSHIYTGTPAEVSTVWLSAPQNLSAGNTEAGVVSVSWDQNPKVNGYELRFRTGSESSTLVVGGNSSTHRSISGLVRGRSYTISVRSYKKVNGTTYYSGWSASQTVRIDQ